MELIANTSSRYITPSSLLSLNSIPPPFVSMTNLSELWHYQSRMPIVPSTIFYFRDTCQGRSKNTFLLVEWDLRVEMKSPQVYNYTPFSNFGFFSLTLKDRNLITMVEGVGRRHMSGNILA